MCLKENFNNKKLILRYLKQEDVDELMAIENDERYWYLSGTITPFSKEDLLNYINNAQADIIDFGQLRFVIDYGNKFVGLIDLYGYNEQTKVAGVGIILKDEFRKQGIAHKALGMLINYSNKKLGLKKLYAIIENDNQSSIKLFERSAFFLKEDLRKYLKKGNDYVDCKKYYKNIN